MIPDDKLRAQLPHTLRQIDLPALGELYRGKVRDNYSRGDRIVMVTTDRVSAFDHVLGTIPFKGEVLSRLTAFWFEKVKDLAPTHVVDLPDPSVMVVKRAKPLPIEIVIRGYITGSLWRDYQAGKAGAYGIAWPQGLRKDQRFDRPIITPSTKAEYGKHDEPISEREILAQGLVAPDLWREATAVAERLFQRGQEWALSRGLILVDTKYEMGTVDGKLVVIDEIHTPDSSRYWVADGYEERFARGRAGDARQGEHPAVAHQGARVLGPRHASAALGRRPGDARSQVHRGVRAAHRRDVRVGGRLGRGADPAQPPREGPPGIALGG